MNNKPELPVSDEVRAQLSTAYKLIDDMPHSVGVIIFLLCVTLHLYTWDELKGWMSEQARLLWIE